MGNRPELRDERTKVLVTVVGLDDVGNDDGGVIIGGGGVS